MTSIIGWSKVESIQDLKSILSSINYKPIKQKKDESNFPIVVNTWPFVNATQKAWQILNSTDDAISAVIEGCSECEDLRCDGTVGFGGSPDEQAETSLDALIIDGRTHDAGSVASIKRIKSAIKLLISLLSCMKISTLLSLESLRSFFPSRSCFEILLFLFFLISIVKNKKEM